MKKLIEYRHAHCTQYAFTVGYCYHGLCQGCPTRGPMEQKYWPSDTIVLATPGLGHYTSYKNNCRPKCGRAYHRVRRLHFTAVIFRDCNIMRKF